ncbi:MAG: RNase adapter RapZ [Deltaproteobacteria bacterium]|jgi:UPF0042 nucleotide-binding protein|nr:RNase adapter RapZ [Deltaproteobacteria bacterium]
MRIVIVTGLSGAGKSTALRALEDIDFFCVDNLPLPMVGDLVELVGARGVTDVAVSVDARQRAFLDTYRGQVDALRAAGHDVDVVFLGAPDEVLIRRYSETRRKHPLAGEDLLEGIRRDREVLDELRQDAEVVDTKALNVHQLKGIVEERFGQRDGTMAVTLLSFGFKHGLPPESNVVFDVRFLPNPYFVEELSGLNGKDPRVARYVLDTDEGRETFERVESYLRFALPRFESEGKKYLTIAIGCTGGRHRSVAMVEGLKAKLAGDYDAFARHRDLGDSE